MNRVADRLATVALDGTVWHYRRASYADRFELSGRIPIPGADQPSSQQAQWWWYVDDDPATEPEQRKPLEPGVLGVASIAFAGPTMLLILRTDGRLWAVDVESGGFAWTLPTVGLEGRLDGLVISPDDQRFAIFGGPNVRLFATLGAPLTGVATLSKNPSPTDRFRVWFNAAGDLLVGAGKRTLVRRAAMTDAEMAAAMRELPLAVGTADPRSSIGDLPTSRDRRAIQYTASNALAW